MKKTLANAAKKGRFGDDRLLHVSRHEIKGLESLIGTTLPTNPDTGLKEAFFFLPFLFGAAAAPAAAAAAAPVAAGIGAAATGAAGLAGLAGTATGLGAAGTAAAGGLGALGATTAAALPAAGTIASALPAAATAAPTVASALPAAATAAAPTAGLSALGGAAGIDTMTTGALSGVAAPSALTVGAAPIIQGGGATSALGASAPLTVGGSAAPIIGGGGATSALGASAPLTVGGSAPSALGGSSALATTNLPGVAYGGGAAPASALGGAAKAAPVAAAKSPAALATTNLPSVSYTGSGLPGSAAEAAGNAFPATTAGANTASSGGLGSLFGGGTSSQLMQGLGLMALMRGNGGGGGGKEKEKDVSGIKYNGGDPVFPDDSYEGGIDPEWDYFPNEHYYATGGLVALAGGGRVPGSQVSKDQKLIKATVDALQGKVKDPQPIIQKFIQEFGQQALQDLISKLSGGGAPRGDGMSDSIPAMINGQQPAALSEGEYVVPADVVSGLGNGATNAGVAALDQMSNNVRQARSTGAMQPPPIDPNQMMPGYAGGGMVKSCYADGGPVTPAGGMGGAYGQGMSTFNSGLGSLMARMSGGMGGPPQPSGGGLGNNTSMFTGQQVRPMQINTQRFVAPTPIPPQPVPTTPATGLDKLKQFFAGLGGNGNPGGGRGAASGGNGNGFGGH